MSSPLFDVLAAGGYGPTPGPRIPTPEQVALPGAQLADIRSQTAMRNAEAQRYAALAQQQNAKGLQDQRDEAAIQRALAGATDDQGNVDENKLNLGMMREGVSPAGMYKAAKERIDFRRGLAQANQEQLDLHREILAEHIDHMQGLLDKDPSEAAQNWDAERADLTKAGITDAPAAYDPIWLKAQLNAGKLAKSYLKQQEDANRAKQLSAVDTTTRTLQGADGLPHDILVRKDTGETIRDLGVSGTKPPQEKPTISEDKDGNLWEVTPGKPAQPVMTEGGRQLTGKSPAAASDTEVITRNVGGKVHNILIQKSTGKDLQDLGEKGLEKTPVEPGTWTLQEGPDGKPVLFNSKTSETKAAPSGIQPKGTFAKTEPGRDALSFANAFQSKMDTGRVTGSDDIALADQFFQLAKPKRMSQPQLAALMDKTRSLTSGAGVWLKRQINPDAPLLSDDQRRNILDTMRMLAGSQAGVGGGAGAGGGVPTPKSQAEYDALPKGSRFMKPNDQTVYTKQ